MGNFNGRKKDFLATGSSTLGVIVATLVSTVEWLLGFASAKVKNKNQLTMTLITG